MNIVLAGGSGFIGTALSKRLLGQGHTVVVIATSAPRFTHQNLFFIQCDIADQTLPYNVLEHADAVINLVGASISTKWTPETKKAIEQSRVKSTDTIVAAIAASKSRPQVFICASATGFYGDTGETISDEQTEKGEGFLADVVVEWELAARKATEYGVRVVCIRTAPVIGQGGIMDALHASARLGVIPKLRKRDYWFSWISEADIVSAYVFALETSTLQGVVNAAAPEPVQSGVFVAALQKLWKHRITITVPQWVMKRKFGEGYEEIVADSRVIPKRLLDKGFEFAHPTIESAVQAYEQK